MRILAVALVLAMLVAPATSAYHVQTFSSCAGVGGGLVGAITDILVGASCQLYHVVTVFVFDDLPDIL